MAFISKDSGYDTRYTTNAQGNLYLQVTSTAGEFLLTRDGRIYTDYYGFLENYFTLSGGGGGGLCDCD
jgi:flagellar basal body rod protein FlgG